MNTNELFPKADAQIRRIVEHYNVVFAQPGSLSAIELDLMLEEVRQFYTTLKIMSQQVMPSVQVNAPMHGQGGLPRQNANEQDEKPAKADTEPPQPKAEPVFEPQPEAEVQVAQPAVEEKADNAPKTSSPAETTPLPKESTKEAQPKRQGPNIAESFAATNKPLGDTLGQPQEQLANRLQQSPISNMMAAIGLNDRYLFISELFEQNADAFHQAIQQLNSAVDLDQALYVFRALEQPHWKEASEVVAKLEDLIHRKFGQ